MTMLMQDHVQDLESLQSTLLVRVVVAVQAPVAQEVAADVICSHTFFDQKQPAGNALKCCYF